jgi:hypothetical protein
MATSVKRASKPKAAALLTPPKTSAVNQFLRFYHSESLRAKTLTVLTAVEKAEDGTRHRDALADIVAELTDSGLHYYFLKPVEACQGGLSCRAIGQISA